MTDISKAFDVLGVKRGPHLKHKYLYIKNGEYIYPEDKKANTKAKTTSVFVAPFYDQKIHSLDEANSIQKSPAYKKHIETLKKVAQALDIKVIDTHANVGRYTNQDGDVVDEIATVVDLNTDDFVKTEEFAALTGALAPEVQESTIAAYNISEDQLGSDDHTANQISFTVDDVDKTLKLAKECGLDFSLDPDHKTISFLDFQEDWFDSTGFDKNISTFVEKLQQNKIKHNVKYIPIKSKLIEAQGEHGREAIFEKIRNKAGFFKGREELRDALQEATKRNKEFIRQQSLAVERKTFGLLRQKQILLQEKGDDLSSSEIQKLTELQNTLLPSTEETFVNAKEDYDHAKEEIEAEAKIASNGIGFLAKFPLKKPSRAAVKTLRWYEGKAQWLGDGARVNIIVFNNNSVDTVLKRIQQQFNGGIVRQELDNTNLGYPKKLIEVRTSNGKIAEFQVMNPESYLAKDGVNYFPKEYQPFANEKLLKIQSRLGWDIPDGIGHYFYEVNRDLNVPKNLRDQAKEISLKYYDAFSNPDSKLTESEFKKQIIDFKNKVDAADKSDWDNGNAAKSPSTLNDFLDIKKAFLILGAGSSNNVIEKGKDYGVLLKKLRDRRGEDENGNPKVDQEMPKNEILERKYVVHPDLDKGAWDPAKILHNKNERINSLYK